MIRFALSPRRAIVMMWSAAALVPFAYWIAAYLVMPYRDIGFLALYRFGDLDYYPMIKALAGLDFHPTFDSTHAPEGMSPFPDGGIFIHAAFLRLFGMYGFIAADVTVLAIFFYAVYRICRAVAPTRPWLAVGAAVLSATIAYVFPYGMDHYFYFYHLRIPRPFVSGLWLLLFIGSFVRIESGERPLLDSARAALWLGALTGLELESDIYNFIVMALLLGIAFVRDAIMPRRAFLRAVLPRYALGAGACLVFAIPFFLAQIYGNPDLKGRLGLFPIRDHAAMLEWFISDSDVISGLVGAGVLLVLAAVPPLSRKKSAFRNLALLLLAAAAAPVLFMSVSPFEIQPYHHAETVVEARNFCAFVAVVAILDMLIDRLPASRESAASLVASLVVIASVADYCFIVGTTVPRIYEMRPDIASVSYPRPFQYRSDLARLMRSLDDGIGSAPSPHVRLLTNDYMLMTWWIMKGYGDLGLLNSASSVLSDTVLERKLIAAGKQLRWSTDEWVHTFLDPPFREGLPPNMGLFNTYVAQDKYQASALYSYAPLSDYWPAELRLIESTSSSWLTLLPLSEVDRLRHAYEQGTAAMEPMPDIVVLTCYRQWPCDRHPGLAGIANVRLITIDVICVSDARYCDALKQ